MSRRLTFSLIVMSGLLMAGSGCKRSNSLHYLNDDIGRQPQAIGLWDTEPLHSQLKDLTGDQYDQFIKYMKDAAPLVRDKYVYSYSRIAQDSTKGYAFLLVDTDKGKILAAIVTNYQIQKFQSPAETFTVPTPLQNKLDSLEK
jgi:hypothetical protein